VETAGMATVYLVNEGYQQEYKELVND